MIKKKDLFRVAGLPLCIDLDGTLLRTDLLHESLLALLARNPLYLFFLPLWLLQGKAAFKRQIAQRVSLAVNTLPYDERVLALLRDTRQRQQRMPRKRVPDRERLEREVAPQRIVGRGDDRCRFRDAHVFLS